MRWRTSLISARIEIMYSRVTRTLMTIVSVVALTFWANHCILADVLASTSSPDHSKHEQRNDNSDHGHSHENHCHGDGGADGSSRPGNHHSGCQDQGCCSPAIQSSHSVDSNIAFVLVHLPAIVVAALEIPSSISVPGLIRAATGPPMQFFQALIAHSIAPNAPPL